MKKKIINRLQKHINQITHNQHEIMDYMKQPNNYRLLWCEYPGKRLGAEADVLIMYCKSTPGWPLLLFSYK